MKKRSARMLLLVFTFWLATDSAWCQVVNYDLRAGLAYYAQGDLEAAIPALERAIQNDSTLSQAYVALGSAFLGMQRYYRAELLTQQGREHFPELKALLVLRAEALMGLREFEAALSLFKQIETELKRGPLPSLPDLQMAEVRGRIGQLHQLIGNTAVQSQRNKEALTHFENALRYFPDSLSAYHNVAVLQLEDQNWTKVREITNQGLTRFPNQTQLLQMKGAALLRLEAYGELEDVYERLFQILPDSAMIGITYAGVLTQNHKNAEAIRVFDTLLDRFPEDRRVYDTLIEQYTSTLNFPAALAVLRRMQTRFPTDANVLTRISDVYEGMNEGFAARAVQDSVANLTGDLAAAHRAKARSFIREDSLGAATKQYQLALSATDRKNDILGELGKLLERQARWQEALSIYLRLIERERAVFPLIRIGWVLEQLNKPDEAIDYYLEAFAQGTRDPLAAFRIAVLGPDDSGPAATVMDTFELVERALNLSLQAVQEAQEKMMQQVQESATFDVLSQDSDPKQRKEELDAQGELAEEIFEYFIDTFPSSRTEPVLLQTLRRYPGSGRLHFLVGGFYLKYGEPDKAVSQFQESTRFAPELREAHLALGRHFSGTGEDLRAIQSYERAIALAPETGDAYVALISLYRKQNALDRLIDRWRARYRATPDNAALHDHLIEALHRAGRLEEARRIVQSRPKNKY